MGIATWVVYTIREGKVNLRTLSTRPFFKYARAEAAKAQTYRLVIVPSYSPS
jgi:hypothetical protein